MIMRGGKRYRHMLKLPFLYDDHTALKSDREVGFFVFYRIASVAFLAFPKQETNAASNTLQ